MQESRRIAAAAPHTVEYFHDAADPYAHLAAQVLGDFAARYDRPARRRDRSRNLPH